MIYLFFLALFLTPSSAALAYHGHHVYGIDGVSVTSVIPNDVWEAAMRKALARWNAPQKIYPAGTVWADDSGVIVDFCPWWYFMGCVLTEE